MKAYKGFNPDMTCRGFKYEEGKEYETAKAECCASGFHACEHPLDCFNYYDPGQSVYHEVEVDGDIDRDHGDTKVAATKIKIGARLTIARLVKAAIDYTMARVKPEAKADEERGASSATGVRGASSATGDGGASSATGYGGASSATGDGGASSATGDGGASSAGNPTAIAVAWGIHGKARGVEGAHIVLADWRIDENYDWHLHGAKMVRIDGKEYKADTWYMMENGKIVEVK